LWYRVQDLVYVLSRDLQDHIYPIKQWSGYLVLVVLDVVERTDAWFFWVFVVAAFAGIHRGDEHEVRRVLDSPGDSRDDDGFVFQWLSQDFKRLSGKFSQFIKEKNSLVGERNFTWCEL